MIHSIYGFDAPVFQARRPSSESGGNSASASGSGGKPSIANMRNIFRSRRANSESGGGRPGPDEAGPSRVTSRAPTAATIPENSEVRSPPIDIPAPPPGYASQLATAPIPSYEVALSQSPTGPSAFSFGSGPATPGTASPPPPARSAFLDYRIPMGNGFASGSRSGAGPTTAVGAAAALGTSTGSRGCAIADEDETDEDDPLTPRIIRPSPALNLVPLPQRRATFAAPERPSIAEVSLPSTYLPVELPRPPANALPAYSPHLLRDELRLISAVHLDQTHPAAAFFNHIATSFTAPGGTQRDQPRELSTGGKKLKVVMTKGAEKMNTNGTGPIFIRLPRGGEIAGRIEVGKVDHATKLEVAIIGLVNTSYYIRGQYTLIDTLPLCRRLQVLYPPPPPESTESATDEPTVTISADGIERSGGSSGGAGVGASAPSGPTATVNADSGPSTTNGNSGASTSTPAVLDNGEEAGQPEQVVGKDGLPYLTQGQTFEFALKMPNHHYRETNIELPPTASIFQVGMQAGVEYVLRVKMSRKGWRLNETITIPIIYEPRAYVSPRRLRALTTDDAMNPGWRTIKLHGGEPSKAVATGSAGVDVTLLLPSPPIVFVPWASDPPPIPFHLHFHSSLPHALATFSDPKQSNFVIRLMRVATMRIGTEREIRRMEVPAKVEIWQEGGPKIVLSDPRAKAAAAAAGASASASAMPGGVPAPVNPALATSPSSTGSTTSPVTTNRRGSIAGSATETRRQSFLRRLSLDRSDSRDAPSPASLQRQPSNLPAATVPSTVTEEPESTNPTSSADTDTNANANGSDGAAVTAPANDDPLAPQGEVNPASPESPLAPLSLSSTDVHFLGQLTISYPTAGPELLRRLVQSFMTPEIGITYVLEVGLQPNAGSVKEAFKHVWGGGMVEVVLGARPAVPDENGEAGAAASGSGTGSGGVNLRPTDGRT